MLHQLLINSSINFSSILIRINSSCIKVFTPGTDSRTADKYVFQNRSYGDTFLIKNKACGIAINAESEG